MELYKISVKENTISLTNVFNGIVSTIDTKGSIDIISKGKMTNVYMTDKIYSFISRFEKGEELFSYISNNITIEPVKNKMRKNVDIPLETYNVILESDIHVFFEEFVEHLSDDYFIILVDKIRSRLERKPLPNEPMPPFEEYEKLKKNK